MHDYILPQAKAYYISDHHDLVCVISDHHDLVNEHTYTDKNIAKKNIHHKVHNI